ncbi:ORF6N domain-containing protein [Proteus mirabilis]|uniref:ORF6N domain-containing protein n=1 Tax=Proteus mirabilis TaxID=584 RepID=UPI0025526320|nr:ORF6N domain-containing protein [Proteus mirabilis]MDK6973325.1 ORF6N domain-containing protein [Proteus mirabilis]
MSTLTVQNLPPVQHNGFRVITTELLANVYETEINNIQQNFKRNKKRFIEGKHYFKIVGDALNNLRLTMSQLQISTKVRSLILWTERGAARHAKMLDTDKAWDVFEALEDFYFTKKEDAKQKTTTDDRAPLRNAVDCLMTKKRLSFPKAYAYVHAKYGVNSIDEVPLELLPEAVDYIYKVALEGEYIPKQEENILFEPNQNSITVTIPKEGRWLVSYKNGKQQVVSVDGHNVVSVEYIRKLQRDSNALIELLQNFRLRTQVMQGEESGDILNTPLIA